MSNLALLAKFYLLKTIRWIVVTYLAGQVVNLLNPSWAFFMPVLLDIGGCLFA